MGAGVGRGVASPGVAVSGGGTGLGAAVGSIGVGRGVGSTGVAVATSVGVGVDSVATILKPGAGASEGTMAGNFGEDVVSPSPLDVPGVSPPADPSSLASPATKPACAPGSATGTTVSICPSDNRPATRSLPPALTPTATTAISRHTAAIAHGHRLRRTLAQDYIHMVLGLPAEPLQHPQV